MANSTELPPKAVALFKAYLSDPPLAVEEVCARLDQYLEFVAKVAERNPEVHRERAIQIAGVLKQLLSSAPEGKYKYAQAAARYFMEDEDAEEDLLSAQGFDDDLLVVNSVANHFGQPGLALD